MTMGGSPSSTIMGIHTGGNSSGCNDHAQTEKFSSDCYTHTKGRTSFTLKNLHQTDTELAELAAMVLGGQILYWRDAEKWLMWNGRQWVADESSGLVPLIEAMLRRILFTAVKCDDTAVKDSVLKCLNGLESIARQEAVIRAMTVLPKLIVNSNQLDADPMLLNCLNGTLNLETGALLAHDPSHRITRMVNEHLDADALCPLFEKFIDTIFCGNSGLIAYVQRVFGYCLTGKTGEQVMFFLHGKGANGKSILLKLFTNLLSDFAVSAQAELLVAKGKRGGASSEIARLRAARIVAVNEIQEDARLNEAMVKSLTSGDCISAGHPFKNFIEFDPQFKLILVGNCMPIIRGQDHAIWRRIHMLPFTATISSESERDPDLLVKLSKELQGILAWAVRGCMEWQQAGLQLPA